ncbi:unnamed protein product [Schistosoma margrebowiei]|uniref:Uncharacterized protein n=1 Tax=Schistosoma margrebowiei TaxID=48269 RepID=A0A183M9U5_9TREM|nr:unnamed protein product [Schistosoma margrebowiei]
MNNRGIPMLPRRWLKCPRMGDMILDIFIPFKTPLDNKFDHFIDPDDVFHVDDAFKTYKLGLIIDLTKSHRFYNRREVTEQDCKYLKIECKGNEERPTSEQVNLFIQIKIGMYAFYLNYGYVRVDIAVQIFSDARPPGIYKADYLEDLFTRYGCIEDCPQAPSLPDWCTGITQLLSENQSVPTSWNESIVVTIFKKGSRCSCNNYRGISLLPIASKLLASVILRRLFKTRERLTREEQAGFRPGR